MMDIKDFIIRYELSKEIHSAEGINKEDYKVSKGNCGYCFAENEVRSFFGSIYSDKHESIDLVSVTLSYECCECGKTNNPYDKVIIKGVCGGCDNPIEYPYYLSDLEFFYPLLMNEIEKHGKISFENGSGSDCVKQCSNTKEE